MPRWIPAVFALVIALAPVSLELCEVMCATDVRAPQHSCHETGSESIAVGQTVAPGAHTCGHSDELPAMIGAVAQLSVQAPAIVPTLFALPADGRLARAPSDSALGFDFIPIALTLPLRI